MNQTPLVPNRWLAAGVIALIFYLCLLHGLDGLGLIGPDEPRFAAIARGMAESGDWVTPRLHGEPWFEKPILYYWSAAAAFRIFGINEFSARLPSVLAAGLMLLVLSWTAVRFYGTATAQAVALMLPACVASIGFARGATTDMLFSAWLTAAMAAAAAMFFPSSWCLVGSQTSRVWPALFGANLGMAALAKGPAAILLAGGSIGLWILLTRRWRDALRPFHPLSIIAFGIIAVPWYVLCALRNPEFFDVFFLSHNVARFFTPVFRHEQPFWFFGPVLLLGLLPWSALLLLPLRDALQRFRSPDRAAVSRNSVAFFVACWAIFPFLFFSASRSKLPGYVLPAVPALVFLMAYSVTRSVPSPTKFFRITLAAVGASMLVLALSTGYWQSRLPQESPIDASHVRWLVLVVGALAAGTVVLGWYGRVAATLQSAALMIAGIVAVFHFTFIPSLDAHLSARTAATVVERAAAGQPIAVHQLHRAWHYGLNYYFHRALPEWSPEMAAETIVVTNESGVEDLLKKNYRVTGVKYFSERVSLVKVTK